MSKPNMAKLGYGIRRVFTASCPVPPWLMVDAVFNGVGVGLWTYYSPGWKDLFRYGAGFGYRHQPQAYFDAADAERPSIETKIGRYVWALNGALDHFIIGMLLVDSIRDGLYTWSSNALTFAGCNQGGDPYAAKATRCVGGWPGSDGWQIGPTFSPTGNHLYPEIGPILSLPAGWSGYISMWFEIADLYSGLTVPFQCRVRDYLSGAIYDRIDVPDPQITKNGYGGVWTNQLEAQAFDRELRVEIALPGSGPADRFVPASAGMACMRRAPPVA